MRISKSLRRVHSEQQYLRTLKYEPPLALATARVLLLVVFCACYSLSPDANSQTSENVTTEQCLECHETVEADKIEVSLEDILESSIHAGFECVDCHTDVLTLEHDEELKRVNCGNCHDDVAAEFVEHGRETVGSDTDLPSCADCHGTHDICAHVDGGACVRDTSLSATCGSCHEDSDIRERHSILKDADIIKRYRKSVHAIVKDGDEKPSATCIQCHSTAGTAHQIIYTRDPRSSLSHFNSPNTCGNCHTEIAKEYWRGIHGQLVAEGATDAPVCVDCHGEHSIISPRDPNSPVSSVRLAEATCVPCHESARLNEKYGIVGSVVKRVDSYHGTKSAAGDVRVANCASCHQAHLILPHTDSLSSIFPANLQKTCGECHPDITPAVASIRIHAPPAISASEIAAVIKTIYIGLIVLIVGGMLVYCAMDYHRRFREMLHKPQTLRMTRNEVWQHTALMVTFIALVLTGFSLRHGDAWWVKGLFGWPGGFELRGLIHRVSALAFIATTLWHTVYLFTAPGRRFIADMAPTTQDVRECLHMLRYNSGLSSTHPQFGRFGFVEKAEYWALVWGTIVMIITGILLWFENDIVALLSVEVFDIALVIHYYEAWLATLAILVWHLYATVFSPDVYPMNPAWLTGHMPTETHRKEHGRYESKEPGTTTEERTSHDDFQ